MKLDIFVNGMIETREVGMRVERKSSTESTSDTPPPKMEVLRSPKYDVS